MKKYIFENFKNTKKYKKDLLDIVKNMTNIEFGGNRFYDGSGSHYMASPLEVVETIFFLKKYEKKNKFKFQNFLEIGFASGVNNSFFNKFFKFKKIVAVDLLNPFGINFQSFFANLRFKNITFIAGDSTNKNIITNVSLYSKFDLIFIDGGHDYEIVRKDFYNYNKFLSSKGIIIMHDIKSTTCPGVPKFWNELKNKEKSYNYHEIFDNNQKFKNGTGILFKK